MQNNETPVTEKIVEEALKSESEQYNKYLNESSRILGNRKLNIKNIDNLDIEKSPTHEIRYLLQKYNEKKEEFNKFYNRNERGTTLVEAYETIRNKIINRINDILDSDPNISSEFIPTLPQQPIPSPIKTSRYKKMMNMTSHLITGAYNKSRQLMLPTKRGGKYTKKRKTNKRKTKKRYSSLKL